MVREESDEWRLDPESKLIQKNLDLLAKKIEDITLPDETDTEEHGVIWIDRDSWFYSGNGQSNHLPTIKFLARTGNFCPVNLVFVTGDVLWGCGRHRNHTGRHASVNDDDEVIAVWADVVYSPYFYVN